MHINIINKHFNSKLYDAEDNQDNEVTQVNYGHFCLQRTTVYENGQSRFRWLTIQAHDDKDA
jgi:hypothetical protein